MQPPVKINDNDDSLTLRRKLKKLFDNAYKNFTATEQNITVINNAVAGSGGSSSTTSGLTTLRDNAGLIAQGTEVQLTDDGKINVDRASSAVIALTISEAAINHATLNNLESDGHTQYVLANGTRDIAFTSGEFNIGDTGAGDYTSFETDGIVLAGDYTVWEDLQVSISNVRLPASNDPDYEYYAFGIGSGVTFPVLAFALNEYMYYDIQTSHTMKLNTVLNNHIHFTLPDTTNVGDKFKFQLDVIAAAVNVQWAVPAGSPYTAEHTVAANDNTHHRLLEIGDIAASNSTVSTLYKCKLTRIAATTDEYAGDVYIQFNDCHYEKDTLGSKLVSSK